ncbi:hypothetical protein ACKUFH_25530, partial [Escherichia coli]|uniref:hypothetical protein n=1 Tax=Escherichia coli TaxID=562 RepID=UPI00390C4930
LQLHQALYPQIEPEPGLLYGNRDIGLATARVLRRMERNGVLIDSERLQRDVRVLGRVFGRGLERHLVEADLLRALARDV